MKKDAEYTVEIFVQPGFLELELASVISVLRTANEALNARRFSWHLTSDTPGFVNSRSDMLVRAHPAIGDQYLRDCLFVIAGRNRPTGAWITRVRAMQSFKRRVVLLSDAAREYVKAAKVQEGPVTTHWRDVTLLRETGDFPSLSERLVEENNGLLTCAGHGHTVEAVIGILSGILDRRECAEIADLLVVESVRGFEQEQPKGMICDSNLFDRRLQRALRLMESNVESPLRMADLARQAGVSGRQLERLFFTHLKSSPARFYKKIRLRRARILVRNTDMSLIEIALACGFPAATTFSRAFKAEFGETPVQHRTHG